METQAAQIWTPVLTIVGANLALMVTSIGVSIALYLHTDKKIDEFKKSMDSFKDTVSKEMRDFHKTLCEIQSGVKQKEEKNKEK